MVEGGTVEVTAPGVLYTEAHRPFHWSHGFLFKDDTGLEST